MFEKAARPTVTIDDDIAGFGPADTARGAAACVQARQAAGCRLLEFAVHWADLHPGDGLPLEDKLNNHGAERVVLFGGDGTPDVAEFAPAGLGLEIGQNPRQCRTLIADALDLRHRLPYSWKLVRAARVPSEAARRLAFRTRSLTRRQAALVDQRVAGKLSTLTGQKLENLITAEIARVNRENQEREAAAAAQTAFIHFDRPDEHGMVDFSGRTQSPDADRMDKQLTRLARILQARPDCLDLGVSTRGARTLGQWRDVAHTLYITNPVLAVQLLLQDQQDDLFSHVPAARTTPDPDATKDPNDTTDPNDDSDDHQECHDVADGPVDTGLMLELIKRIDASKLAPTAVLHVHIGRDAFTCADSADEDSPIARVDGVGPTLLATVRAWLGEGCTVKLQPIIDADGIAPVDAYEAPDRMRDAVLTHGPGSCFPWSGSLSRHNDLDHAPAYRPLPTGPPGQTGVHSLALLNRHEHRYRTHGAVRVRQPTAGTRVWRTRFARVLITNAAGTHDLGTGAFADAVWAAAQSKSTSVSRG